MTGHTPYPPIIRPFTDEERERVQAAFAQIGAACRAFTESLKPSLEAAAKAMGGVTKALLAECLRCGSPAVRVRDDLGYPFCGACAETVAATSPDVLPMHPIEQAADRG